MTKPNKFFTITTPRKDGSILDKFLNEFGYLKFEKEDRSEDTRRSVGQISSNEELINEVSDFCKDNKCKMQLIYKRGTQLVQQSFQADKIYSPKPYGASEGQDLEKIFDKKETQNVEQKLPENENSITKFFTEIRTKKEERLKKGIKKYLSESKKVNNKKTSSKKTKKRNPNSTEKIYNHPKEIALTKSEPIKAEKIKIITKRKKKFTL